MGGDYQEQDKHDHHHHQEDERRGNSNKATQSSVGKNSVDGGGGHHDNVYFIIPRKVTVLYGPYMFQGMMDYRTERLQGIKSFLEKLGVTVDLTPCLDHVNLCRVWFLDELVFSCKITDLIHGGDGELDPLCWHAAESLEKFIKQVLKGLRKQRPELTSEQLKKPFCPCFQVDHGHHHQNYQSNHQQRLSVGATSSGGAGGSDGRRKSDQSHYSREEGANDKERA